METVGAYEAKTHLPKLLDRVVKGERFTITKHGVPVAVLTHPHSKKKMDTQSVILALRKFRDKHTLGEISLQDMIAEGRR